ncbi:glycoprotein precursor [Aigai virus]|uniref:Envelopment polyprotein n=1 Tax=Aigai virus TaxID=2849717 RepID=Q0P0K0_9VIRU|nr:glycoprotein precursor [Aigai virus]ABB30025.1 glycoprotein precursor [Aigai virus]
MPDHFILLLLMYTVFHQHPQDVSANVHLVNPSNSTTGASTAFNPVHNATTDGQKQSTSTTTMARPSTVTQITTAQAMEVDGSGESTTLPAVTPTPAETTTHANQKSASTMGTLTTSLEDTALMTLTGRSILTSQSQTGSFDRTSKPQTPRSTNQPLRKLLSAVSTEAAPQTSPTAVTADQTEASTSPQVTTDTSPSTPTQVTSSAGSSSSNTSNHSKTTPQLTSSGSEAQQTQPTTMPNTTALVTPTAHISPTNRSKRNSEVEIILTLPQGLKKYYSKILKLLHLTLEEDSEGLLEWCTRTLKQACDDGYFQERIKEFFLTGEGYFNEVLLFRSPSQLGTTGSPLASPPTAEPFKSFYAKGFLIMDSGYFSAKCYPKASNSGLQLINITQHSIKVVNTPGPKYSNLKTVNCINLKVSTDKDHSELEVNVLLPQVAVNISNCHVLIKSHVCDYSLDTDGMIRLPQVTHEGTFIPGTYKIVIDKKNKLNDRCTMTTNCVIKGKEVRKGQSTLRQYRTEIRVGQMSSGTRRLLSEGGDGGCISRTQLIKTETAEVHGDDYGGPGEKITICNGSTIVDQRLGSELGCYTINRIKSFKLCENSAQGKNCEIDSAPVQCRQGYCLKISQEGRGHVKLSRGSEIVLDVCDTSCEIMIPKGTGDILVDCSGGQQHFLQSNLVDLGCPNIPLLGKMAIYICRMSNHPKTTMAFLFWFSFGYVITCILCKTLFYILIIIGTLGKKLKQYRELKPQTCTICESVPVNAIDAEMHDLNCSYNICPYCASRLTSEGLTRHVNQCPKRKEKVEETELYLNLERIPWIVRKLLQVSESTGVALKRSSWMIVLLILLIVSMSPVQSAPISQERTVALYQSREDYMGICLVIMGSVLLAVSLLVRGLIDSISSTFFPGLSVCRTCHIGSINGFEIESHKCYCGLLCCPYCRACSTDQDAHQFHLSVCKKRKAGSNVMLAVCKRMCFKAIIEASNKVLFIRNVINTTFVVCILVMVACIASSAAVEMENLPAGTWEREEELTNFCHQECQVTETECLCPYESFILRKPLFLDSIAKGVKNLLNSTSLETSLSIEAPWGAINAQSTYKPTASSANIALTWSSVEHRGNKILVSGRSESIMKLEERTGISWNLGVEDASESRTLTISVMDLSQMYSPVFEYLSGDRQVEEWPKATCTGNCPERCGCTSSTCLYKEWPHSRNWRCNPTWCWGVGTGCTCCGLDVKELFTDHMLVKWKVEYIKTEAIVCVELTSQERQCSLIEAGTRFSLGPVTITLSEPRNIQQKLPPELITLHPKIEDGYFDLMHVQKVMSASTVCKLQSCTHGVPGDLQIYHVGNLLKGDRVNGHLIHKVEPHLNTSWMSWDGCDLDYFCNMGDWPSCTYTGVTQHNHAAFANLLNIETDYTKTFHFHSKRVTAHGDTPQLDLKARPRYGAGEITVLVEVADMELHTKKVEVTGLKFASLTCSGCYACSSGISCKVRIHVDEPDELTVHVKSSDPDIVAASSSLMARKIEFGVDSTFKAFSSMPKDSLCFYIVERDYCNSCKNEETQRCVNAKLEQPQSILIEHTGTIIGKQNDTCGSRTSCWLDSFKSFFYGLKSMLSGIFGNVFLGIFLFLAPFALLLFFFFFGWRILFCFKCCRRTRGLFKYRHIKDDEEVGYKKIIERLNNKKGKHRLLDGERLADRKIAELFSTKTHIG